MKKIYVFFAALFISVNIAQAKFITIQNESNKIHKVSELQQARDDQHVVLKGNIVKQIDDETYRFSDGTGTVLLDIDEDVWNGVDVTETDIVTIHGEYDKHLFSDPEIDVEVIKLETSSAK